MTKEQKERFVDALLTFVERATNTSATDAEVEALAAVAQVLASFNN